MPPFIYTDLQSIAYRLYRRERRALRNVTRALIVLVLLYVVLGALVELAGTPVGNQSPAAREVEAQQVEIGGRP